MFKANSKWTIMSVLLLQPTVKIRNTTVATSSPYLGRELDVLALGKGE